MDRTDVVLMDGASGTCLWEKAGDRSPVWRYNIENPRIVSELAAEYADAGSKIVMTNTFSANRPSLKKTNYSVREIVSAGVGLAKDAVGGRAKVALDVGPLPVFMEPYGDLTEEEAFEIFDEQIRAGIPEKPDLIMLETFMDADMLRVAAEAAARHDLPIFAAMTFTEVGKIPWSASWRPWRACPSPPWASTAHWARRRPWMSSRPSGSIRTCPSSSNPTRESPS